MNRGLLMIAIMLGVLLALFSASLAAAGFQLITETEFNREMGARASYGLPPEVDAAGDPPVLRGRKSPPGAPQITVTLPERFAGLVPPIDIELRFQPAAGAEIDPTTFRVLYGWLGIDITDRLKEHANITPEGIRAENAELPEGRHELTLEIADTKGRYGAATLEFTIASP